MKRMFSREFVIYTSQNKIVLFNYPTIKGKRNMGKDTMTIRVFSPTNSSWKRVESLLRNNKYPCEMATDDKTGEHRFVFSAGKSLS